ncbi:MAG: HAMP domain-containing protein [Patescibacteria group bacterium]|nr:HAMP domain-containing protein [Patescibacteria group bacterium]
MWGYHLQTKITVIVLIIVVLCVLFSTVFSLYRANAVVEEYLNTDGVFLSQSLAVFSIENLLAWDYPALQLSIKHMAKYDPYILAIKVFHKGNLVASYCRKSQEDGEEYSAPVVIETLGEKRELGSVDIVLSEKKYRVFYMQQIYSLLLLGLFLGLGNTFLIYLIISKMVLSPLRKIERESEIIGKGDLKHQIDIRSKDEIGRLARAINTMTRNLRMSIEEAEDYKKHLEERIDELEKFHELTVGRELKMIELKEKIEESTKSLNKTTKSEKVSKKLSKDV